MLTKEPAEPLLALPPGFFKKSRGGRPKSEARDAAVFLAMAWRMTSLKEKRAEAERQITAEWKLHGITDTRHVRSAVERATDRGLATSLVTCFDTGTACIWSAVECERGRRVVEDRARSWHWTPGMKAAVEGRVKNVTSRDVQEVLDISPVAGAIRSMMRR